MYDMKQAVMPWGVGGLKVISLQVCTDKTYLRYTVANSAWQKQRVEETSSPLLQQDCKCITMIAVY
jgi:hypothetical protein